MIILSLRTDKPEAEVGLFDGDKQLAYEKWPAHRELAETLHNKIAEILKTSDKSWDDIQAVAIYEGPGSFTGLRIGVSVANALAYSLNVPVATASGQDWIRAASKQLEGKPSGSVVPTYGSDAHITTPKK